MGWFRVLTRLVLVTLLTFLHVLILLAGSIVIFVFPRLRARWRMALFRSWSRCILPIMGVRVAVRGEPPGAPFLLVANHLSYLDIPVIGSQVGAIFVAKSEIAGWPGIGFVCRAINTIFIDRNPPGPAAGHAAYRSRDGTRHGSGSFSRRHQLEGRFDPAVSPFASRIGRAVGRRGVVGYPELSHI